VRSRNGPRRQASALELVEGEVERAEARVLRAGAEAGRRLGDVDRSRHTSGARGLEALLKRWEALFARERIDDS